MVLVQESVTHREIEPYLFSFIHTLYKPENREVTVGDIPDRLKPSISHLEWLGVDFSSVTPHRTLFEVCVEAYNNSFPKKELLY